MIFTGVGSRDTPEFIWEQMYEIAKVLSTHGHRIRSGGAPAKDGECSADLAFAAGFRAAPNYIEGNLEEIIPGKWSMFRHVQNPVILDTEGGKAIASRYHPGWDWLKPGAKSLHGRNTHQVLGRNLARREPCDVLICWTKDACRDHASRTRATGGTGTAISIADKEANAFIINMADPKYSTALRVLHTLDDFFTLTKKEPSITVKNVDMWSLVKTKGNFIPCITTNQNLNSKGELVMGAGVALEAKQRYPQLPSFCGDMVKKFGECRGLIQHNDKQVYIFPSKVNWKDPSLKSYIWDSAIALGLAAMEDPEHTYLLPKPGCGLGGLSWEDDVRPILEKLLPSNVWVVNNRGRASRADNAEQTGDLLSNKLNAMRELQF